jgi:NADH dehydrogenase
VILVAGGTGYLGGMIARRLLDGGHAVRVLVRSGSNYQPLVDIGAEPVEGDLKDRASLDAAVAGVDTIITTANSAQRGGNDNPRTVDLEGNANLIDAAQAAGIRRFIFVSALGADPDSPIPFFAAKGKTEQRLRESGMSWTILAPNIYMDVWAALVVGQPAIAGELVTLVGEGKRQHAMVATQDVASFAIAAVGNPAARNQRLVIGGPDALSWRDAAATYERLLGRPVEIRSVAPGDVVPGLPEMMAGALAGFEMFDSPVAMDDLTATYAITLTPFEAFARGHVERASG